ncbi:MAG: NAD-dependent epimerase/dehydratase family protein [Anaerolineales bacterium]|nr:MAG: NAD-dependent epimerase/dehydratase family protein [Anaerolineales bacterium]
MSKSTLITGGAGFIGTNYTARLLKRGEQVTIFDNLSRAGSPGNVNWLKETYGENSFKLIQGDVRDAEAVKSAVESADQVIHLAAQVAVTTSVIDPRTDFEINALGTLNVLEAARQFSQMSPVIYASTNKVYGDLAGVQVAEGENSYYFPEKPEGISESQLMDFHSPYGCSKGTGDQYVRDYHRIFGLKTVVFRQSCIYGPHQFGIEDQGWVAWFVIAAVTGKPITIFGDGKQVRDLLYVDDLLAAYDLSAENIDKTAGQIYNIGGGKENTLSIWKEFGPLLEKELGQEIPVSREPWRPGDQCVFIADIQKANQDFGWKPEVNVETGIRKLFDWVRANRDLF